MVSIEQKGRTKGDKEMSSFYFKTKKRMIAWICAITMVVAGLAVAPKVMAADEDSTDYSKLSWTRAGDSEYYVAPLEAFPMQVVNLIDEGKKLEIIPSVDAGDYKIWPDYTDFYLNDAKQGITDNQKGAGIYVVVSYLKNGYNVFRTKSANGNHEFHIIISKGKPSSGGGEEGTTTPEKNAPKLNGDITITNGYAPEKGNTLHIAGLDNISDATEYTLYEDNVEIGKVTNGQQIALSELKTGKHTYYVIATNKVGSVKSNECVVEIPEYYTVKINNDSLCIKKNSNYHLRGSAYGFYDKAGKVVYKGDSDIEVSSDMQFVEITGLAIDIYDGAAIRLDSKTGIRFKANVALYVFGNDEETKREILESGAIGAGILVSTDDILGEGELKTDSDIKKVNINNDGKWFGETPGEFCGSLVNIVPTNYTRTFVARAYTNINYSSGEQSGTVYSGISVKRSISKVAKAVRDGGYVGIDEADKSLVDSFIVETNNEE